METRYILLRRIIIQIRKQGWERTETCVVFRRIGLRFFLRSINKLNVRNNVGKHEKKTDKSEIVYFGAI